MAIDFKASSLCIISSRTNEIKPNFVADLVVTYVSTPIINDNKSNSAESTVTITVGAAAQTTSTLTLIT